MRPPNPRFANDGSGTDCLTFYNLGIDPVMDADEEGNWMRRPVVATTYRAVVGPGFATAISENGSQISLTTYQVMIYAHNRPYPLTDTPLEWKKSGVPRGTLVGMGEAVPDGPGAWAFQATEAGPNPGGSGKPDGAA